MSEKIALLLQQHFVDYCQKELGDQWQGRPLFYFSYETLEQLRDLFLQNKNRFDGFLVSGSIPLTALREIDVPPYAVKESFEGYLENTYRILLHSLLKYRRADQNRIGLDYLKEGDSLSEILERDLLPERIEAFSQRVEQLTGPELERLEQQIAENYRKRCRAGKLDIVVTHLYSVVQSLAEEPVECYYSYPGRSAMLQTLELLVKNIRLYQFRQNLASVIRIRPDLRLWREKSGANQELNLLSLKMHLLNYFRTRGIEPVLKEDLVDLEIYVSAGQLRSLTGQFSYFDLPAYLQGAAGFQGTVSLGTGENLNQARLRAMEAEEYRTGLEENAVVYMDEKNIIHTLPLSEEKAPEIPIPSDYVETVANRCHLSAATVYRVLSLLQSRQTDQITSEDLIREQNFSLRIATRVLKALAEHGYAEKIGQRRLGGKGRPQNVYRITMGP